MRHIEGAKELAMDVNVAQLERQARLRYLPLKSFVKQGICHVFNPSCAFVSRGDTFGSAVEHCVESDQQLGRRMFGPIDFIIRIKLETPSINLQIEISNNHIKNHFFD